MVLLHRRDGLVGKNDFVPRAGFPVLEDRLCRELLDVA